MQLEMDIRDLAGERITSVAFVLDYLELGFDGPILRFLDSVAVSGDGESMTFPETGSREFLCGVIGMTVSFIEFEEDQFFRLRTDAGWMLETSLKKTAFPEMMHFVLGPNQPIQVW